MGGGEDTDLRLDTAKGPLQSIALAVFGPDSFLSTWQQLATNHPAYKNIDQEINSDSNSNTPEFCIGLAPFGELFRDTEAYMEVRKNASQGDTEYLRYPCGFPNTETVHSAIRGFLSAFQGVDIERLENAFTAASFLANQAWIRYASTDSNHDLGVTYNMGKDTQIPTISTAGIAVVSFVLVTYMTALFALAIYAYRAPRWTNQLDSFAMIRIGSALAQDVPLLATRSPRHAHALDTLSGVMGDAKSEDKKTGKLWPGGETPLRDGKLYYSYHFDHVK